MAPKLDERASAGREADRYTKALYYLIERERATRDSQR